MVYIIIAIIVVLAIYFVALYNGLVVKRNRIKNAWSQVEVQLKRRFDLIPNLVDTVKGYASHEQSVLEGVVAARNKYLSSKSPEDAIEANNELSGMLGRLFALSEAYPDLKANENFAKMQDELKNTEDKITYSRQFYNDTVLIYNNSIEVFPAVIIAPSMGFKPELFFKVDEAEQETPKVNF